MPPIVTVTANLDGTGQLYTVQGWNDAGTSVSLNGKLLWALDGSKGEIFVPGPGEANPANSGWRRPTDDQFIVADLDHDGKQEIVVANDHDGWTGVLEWSGSGLTYPWGSPTPLTGPAGEWNRRGADSFSVTQYQGGDAIAIAGPDGWRGVLAWENAALVPVSITQLTVAVPSVVGMEINDAAAAIFNAGLSVGEIGDPGNPPPGYDPTVYEQNPTAGTVVPLQTEVVLAVEQLG